MIQFKKNIIMLTMDDKYYSRLLLYHYTLDFKTYFLSYISKQSLILQYDSTTDETLSKILNREKIRYNHFDKRVYYR